LNNHLHIVTHDVPYPADFGGVIDIFYKLKWLHAVGIKIHLHCFQYKRQTQSTLDKYCLSVQYYKRKGIESFSFDLPYIVASRSNVALLRNLQKDTYPILFEGVHSTYVLNNNDFGERRTFLRLFNVEYIYYNFLAKNETNPIKKWYYTHEAKCLKRFEKKIANKTSILALSQLDVDIYKSTFDAELVTFLPAFLPNEVVESKSGKGTFCLYHGNLSINENEKAALWLIESVFSKVNFPLIIAGKNPTYKIKVAAKKNKLVQIIANPDDEKLQQLITDAQINVLPSFNNTGVKLKLLNALYNGRHCLVNTAGVEGSGLEEICYIAETAAEFIEKINELMPLYFDQETILKRNNTLNSLYSNKNNALFIRDAIQ
jgi:glycosyltransferase involved in cell wall biosynthesis